MLIFWKLRRQDMSNVPNVYFFLCINKLFKCKMPIFMEIDKTSTFFVMTEKNTAKAAGNYGLSN